MEEKEEITDVMRQVQQIKDILCKTPQHKVDNIKLVNIIYKTPKNQINIMSSIENIINALHKTPQYQVNIKDNIAVITWENALCEISTEHWLKIDKRVNLRKSCPDFSKVISYAELIRRQLDLGFEDIIEQLRAQPSDSENIIIYNDRIAIKSAISHVSRDILIEGSTYCKDREQSWHRHWKYCSDFN